MDLDENAEPRPRHVARGRKKSKNSNNEFCEPLPLAALDGKSPEEIEELESVNKILQSIMNMKNIQPFYEKPNDDSFGMSTYYKIIKNPIWLYEVKRKLNTGEYKGLADFIQDMRLLFENCYRFWGAQHRITRKGLKLEHKFELRLQELPKHILDKLNREMPEGSIDLIDTQVPNEPVGIIDDIRNYENEIDDEINDIPNLDLENDESNDFDYKEDSSNSWEPDLSESIVFYKPDRNASVFESKILKKVMENDIEEDEEDEEEVNKMMSWEREFLVDDNTTQEIRSMWELAEIGSFLKLTYETLNVEEITQYEVERMLLMPKESTTLMTLMTSILSPEVKRPSLDESPLMPYEIWTGKIKRKIDDWINLFYKLNDSVLLFEQLGIDLFFWNICKGMNPLHEKRFHEISFYERAVILKALCNNIFYTNKTIIELFTKEPIQAETLRPKFLGKDSDGNGYISLSILPEIRVYKESKFITKAHENWETQDSHIWKVQKYFSHFFYDEETQDIGFGPTEKFRLMADDLDSLSALMGQLKIDEQFDVVPKLSLLETEAKAYKVKYDGLRALYQQWHRYQNRAPEYFTNMLNLWLRTEKPALAPVVEKVSDSKDFEEDSSSQSVLGKRRSAKLCFTHFVSDDEFESDDEDSWEPSKKKKKKKNEKKKKENEFQNNGINNIEIEIKQEEITQPINNIETYKPFTTQTSVKETPNPPNFPLIKVVRLDKIKEEVISISSDEDDVTYPTKPITSEVTVHPVTINHTKTPIPNKSVIIQKISNPIVRNNQELTIQPVRPQGFNQGHVMNHVPQAVQQRQMSPRQPVFRSSQPQTMSSSLQQQVMRSPGQQQMIRTPQQMIRSPQMMRSPGQQMMRSPGQQMMRSPGQQMMRSPGQQMMRSPGQQMMRSPGQQMMRSPRQFTPRGMQNSPMGPRTPSPASPRRGMPQRQMNPKALFSSPPKRPVPAPISSPPDTISGNLSVGTDNDGTLRYRVKLSDGGIINLSTIEVEELRRNNNGILPISVNVPLVKKKTF